MSELDRLAVDSTVCPRCEAKPTEMCRTISGRASRYVHSSRTDAIYAAWRIGYGEGGTGALDIIEERLSDGVTLTGALASARRYFS